MAWGQRRAKAKAKAGAAVQWYRTRRRVMYGWAQFLVPAAFLAGLLLVRLSGWSWVELAQFRTFDAFQKLKPRVY